MAKDTTRENDDVEIIQSYSNIKVGKMSASNGDDNDDDDDNEGNDVGGELNVFSDHEGFIERSCVICMEVHDANMRKCVEHSNLIITRCECKYYVHEHRFTKWYEARPTHATNCLVCSSEGEIVLPLSEKIVRKCSDWYCKLFLHTFRCIVIGVVAWNVYIILLLVYDNAMVSKYMKYENYTYYDVDYDDDTI